MSNLKRAVLQLIPCCLALLFFSHGSAQSLMVHGLQQQVEVIRDSFGINHIYASNQHDLFFSQGYCAAKDRLFQYEIWRRQATGTVAEVFGPRELKRDLGTRLFKFRGNLDQELASYHPQGKQIVSDFVSGVNAYIDEVIQHPELLPEEFKILHILPGKWTNEVVISRHQGLLGNCTEELNYGMAVARAGSKVVKDLAWFHPRDPLIDLDSAINGNLFGPQILDLYNAYRSEVDFEPSDTLTGGQNASQPGQGTSDIASLKEPEGSNNWVIASSRSFNGHPILANDPHRRISVPSLRYMVHLVAPGWNVIGGGEPEIPGVSIGHNEKGAWGLTIFETDGEDIYVYDLNPANLHQYKYRGKWVDMKKISESIAVKNSPTVHAIFYYTQHGPVTYIDSVHLKAYALRCAWLEPGGSPYLSSLRIDQAGNWDEFRDACSKANIPGENMLWADVDGNIGWQAVGIAPIRKNFSGLVPVPGDGRYEWAGFLPIKEKPHLLNPLKGYFATANQQVTPLDYNHWDALGYTWSDDFRGDRINQVLSQNQQMTMLDCKKLQTDYFSIPAAELIPLLKNIRFSDSQIQRAAQLLLSWDDVLDKNAVPASIYIAWERAMQREASKKFIPAGLSGLIALSWQKTIGWILHPDTRFGTDPLKQRDDFIARCFEKGLAELNSRLGTDMNTWVYGQDKYKHVYITHPLSPLLSQAQKYRFNVGPMPRGGDGDTPGSTGRSDNQTSGASFRMIINTGDWDEAVGINTPGQSGDPASGFYKNLFGRWVNDQYFPVYYSKQRIGTIQQEKLLLNPAN